MCAKHSVQHSIWFLVSPGNTLTLCGDNQGPVVIGQGMGPPVAECVLCRAVPCRVLQLLWTTEKETLFIVKNAGLFGTKAGEVYQVALQDILTYMVLQPTGQPSTHLSLPQTLHVC